MGTLETPKNGAALEIETLSFSYGATFALKDVGFSIRAGEFTVLPAHAEEMYFPEVFGRSAGGSFSVTAAP